MKRAKELNWPALIEEQKRSGKTVKAFCREKGVHYSGFYRFKKRQSSQKLVEVPVKKTETSRGESITIIYRDYTISVPPDFNNEHLRELLNVVKAVSC